MDTSSDLIAAGSPLAIEGFGLAPALDGSLGSNRGRGGVCQLGADTDIDAVRCWLAEYAGSAHT
jgi:hypothetical protein